MGQPPTPLHIHPNLFSQSSGNVDREKRDYLYCTLIQ